MTLAGITLLAAGLLLFSQAQTLMTYYVASLIIALGQSLGSSTPFVAGWMFDHTGSFHTVFTVCAVVAFTGVFWLVLIRRPMWDARQGNLPSASPLRGRS